MQRGIITNCASHYMAQYAGHGLKHGSAIIKRAACAVNFCKGAIMLINKNGMKKLLLAFIAFFVFTSMALAAVNLNTATKEDLDGVKGIGPVKAQAIIDYRKKNGPFKSVNELGNVTGFGDKSVEKIRSELTVGTASPAKKVEVKAAVKPAISVEKIRSELIVGATSPAKKVEVKAVVKPAISVEKIRSELIVGAASPAKKVEVKAVVKPAISVEKIRSELTVGATSPAKKVEVKAAVKPAIKVE